MYKLIQSDTNTFKGEPLVSVIDLHEDFMSKHASADTALAKFVKGLQSREDGVYLHINALGGESWGSNKNGDYFESDVLAHECPVEGEIPRLEDYGYRTFEKYAYPFKHHVNKDVNGSVGEKVAFSTYNDKMDRVELVVFIDRNKDPELCKKAEVGEAIPVSMGCKVLYDVCSVCGNAAKKRDDYCEHLKYAMNQTMPDGRKVYAINKYPRFFDISFVLSPAEKASYVMDKVASSRVVVPSAFIADALGIEEPKRANENKAAAITKEIPVGEVKTEQPKQEVIKAFSSLIPKITSLEPSMPNDTLKSLSGFPLREILSTVSGLGMVLKPQEFQKIIIIKMGNMKDQSEISPDISCDHINDNILPILKKHVVDRSSYRPAIRARVVKLASQNPVVKLDQTLQQDVVSKGLPTVAAIAALYDLARTNLSKTNSSFLLKSLGRNPLLTTLLGATAAAGLGAVANQLEKTSATRSNLKSMGLVGALAYPYFVKAHKEREYRTKGKVPGDVGIQFIKHPGLIGLGSLYGAAKLLKKAHFEKFASISDRLKMERVISWPLIEDAPDDLIDAAIINGFVNL